MSRFQYLQNRALISIKGEGVLEFLQGLITNDVHKLTNSNLLYTLFLTPQGKFLYDAYLMQYGLDHVLLECEATCQKEIIQKLTFYKLRKKIDITGFDDLKVMFAESPIDKFSFEDPRHSNIGYRCYEESAPVGFVEDQSLYNTIIYSRNIPDPHVDMMQSQSFPLEYQLDEYNAIDFRKGCYVGQELTTRVKHRGVVRKKLVKFTSGSVLENIEWGEAIEYDGNKVGIYCSSFGNIGKALVRNDDISLIPHVEDAKLLLKNYVIKISS